MIRYVQHTTIDGQSARKEIEASTASEFHEAMTYLGTVGLAPIGYTPRPQPTPWFIWTGEPPEPEKTKLLERGISDYERTYELQKAYFPTLTLHSREQLLYGLTDGYANLGKTDKAKSYFEQMQTDAAGSELLPRAASRAKGEAVEGQTPCEQCHRAR